MRIPIVDEQDNILYYKEKEERDVHKEITRITALWVLNQKGEVLIAKRSKNKNHHPNMWGPSVSGTMEEGEVYESNIVKEAKEEIGVILENFTLGPKVRHNISHAFFVQWFFATIPSNTTLKLQESEVDDVKWITTSDLQQWYNKNPEEFVPRFPQCLEILKYYENKS